MTNSLDAATGSAIAGAAGVTATFTGGVVDSMASLYDTGSAARQNWTIY